MAFCKHAAHAEGRVGVLDLLSGTTQCLGCKNEPINLLMLLPAFLPRTVAWAHRSTRTSPTAWGAHWCLTFPQLYTEPLPYLFGVIATVGSGGENFLR